MIQSFMEKYGLNILAGKIRVDFRSSVPIYLQIARQIELLVSQGDLKIGDQLPTVRELATELRINFNTVTRAYRVLDEARLISTQRGRGTYIWEEPTEESMKAMRQKTIEELAVQFLRETHKLGYSDGEAVEALQAVIRTGASEQKLDDAENENLRGQ
jgi:GntR family transcriptional regulator